MIFISRNEKGVPAWKLVMLGKKTVTRRLKPEPVGAIRAVCPSRGKKAVCHIKIVSCMTSGQWHQTNIGGRSERFINNECDREAQREGFGKWYHLISWFDEHKIPFSQTYRIEFKLVKKAG